MTNNNVKRPLKWHSVNLALVKNLNETFQLICWGTHQAGDGYEYALAWFTVCSAHACFMIVLRRKSPLQKQPLTLQLPQALQMVLVI